MTSSEIGFGCACIGLCLVSFALGLMVLTEFDCLSLISAEFDRDRVFTTNKFDYDCV